jgi:hypothetical protein
LSEDGWERHPRLYAPNAERDRYFSATHFYVFQEQELEECELLRLTAAQDWDIGWKAVITRCPYMKGKDGQRVVSTDAEFQRKRIEFGVNGMTSWFFFAVDRIKTALESAGLVGLKMVPTTPEDGRAYKKPLWELSSSIVLPPCLTPRQAAHDGSDVIRTDDETRKLCLQWDDRGRIPAVLRFLRKEIEALGPFDIAVTREGTGEGPPWMWAPAVIVSPRFRRVMAELGVKHHYYAPVHLE